jgi:hypothetical protein
LNWDFDQSESDQDDLECSSDDDASAELNPFDFSIQECVHTCIDNHHKAPESSMIDELVDDVVFQVSS